MVDQVRKGQCGGNGVDDICPPLRETLPTLTSEQTPIGEQMLVHGVAPITPRDRLAFAVTAPLCARKPQRSANHGLFDMLSRSQIEMF